MFGQSGNTTFGGFGAANPTTPFGGSPFAKQITPTSFGGGAPPVFGSTNTSLFGSKPAGAPTGSLFGSTVTAPSFGQPATSQPSFGGFSNPNTNTNLFGAQQNANTGLFGTTNTTSAFGQANKPTGFGFGSSTGTGLFGQTQQPAQQTTPSLFGPSNSATNTSVFGTAPGFANSNTAGGMTGTVVKFNAPNGTDTMIKNGVTQTISTRHYCITCMKEYEGKSLEELRLEDYTAGRKGQTQGAQTTSLFGATAQPSLFGNPSVNTSTASTGFGATTTAFGAQPTQPAATSGLFGKPITGFGATTTTSSAFPFNSTTTTSNPFGANTQTKSFGAPGAAPLFGTPNTNQATTTGFGTNNTSAFGSFSGVQPNQSIGLFNQNKSAFMPASTASTGFPGFGQNTATNTGGGLFGAKPTGTTGFGTVPSFGTTPAPSFSANTGFGQPQNTGTSLFNSTFKPAGQTGFSFGGTPSTSTGLGVNSGLNLGSTPLFGQQKPPLFGTSGTNTTFNSTGTFGLGTNFGANNNTTGLGLGTMGGGIGINQPQQNSGAMQVHQQILALVSAPFGHSPLLKNLLPASGKTEELLKPSNPATRALNSPQYKVATNSSSPKVRATAVTNAQLSKKSLFEGLEEEDPALQEAFQPRANAKRLVLRPKPISSSEVQSPDRLVNSPVNHENENVNVEGSNKENQQQELVPRPTDDRKSSTSWLRSTLQRKSKLPDEEFEGSQITFRGSDITEESLDNTVAELRSQNNAKNISEMNSSLPAGDNFFNASTNLDKSIMNSTQSSNSSHEQDDMPSITSPIDYEPNAAAVILRRAGYYTIPPLDKLEEYVCGETCIVPHFTVGRKGYGNVFFPDSFDVYGLNLDEIVHFRNKEVIIYPDDDKKPPIGEGLNRKAQVTLDRVWPHDKTLHEPITDPICLAAMNYEGKLRRVSAKHDTKFVEYRAETGSWVFKVDHFSKYGLSDSDDDEDDIPVKSDLKKLKIVGKAPSKMLNVNQEPFPMKDALDNKQRTGLMEVLNGDKDVKDTTTNFQMDTLNETVTMTNEFYSRDHIDQAINIDRPVALSPSTIFARMTGTDSHKLQLMKASFFDDDDEDIDDADFGKSFKLHAKTSTQIPRVESMEALEGDQMVPSDHMSTLRFSSNIHTMTESFIVKEPRTKKDESESSERFGPLKVFPSPIVRPKTVVLKYPTAVIPFADTIVGKLKARCIADTGIQMGRRFRAGWGPGLTLLSLSTQKQAAVVPLYEKFSQLGSYVSGRLLNDTTSSIVQRLQIVGGGGGDMDHVQMFKESIVGHLRIQLDHCILGQEGDCPAVGAGAGSRTLHAHCNIAQELADLPEADSLATYASHVWNLCVALWGNLPDLQSESDTTSHHNVMIRREALSEWLENVLTETATTGDSNGYSFDERILSLLSAHKLEEACKLTSEAGDHCLALVMAQLGGAPSTRVLIRQQLAAWQYTEVDTDLPPERLKLFMLAAGEPIITQKNGSINVCENLEWKRALGIHLWYVCPPTASITDAVSLYETAFDAPEVEAYAAAPYPKYRETDYEPEMNGKKTFQDLSFHLLKLYCTGNHSLEKLLNPLTHTADPLDYRLSWLIQQVLVALGYSHLSAHVSALTHINFAAQLEAYGLWQWAIFVMLHLEDTGRRRGAVVDLLARHVELDETTDYIKREEFLREELGIPSMWINKAKATKARAFKRYGEAAWYLIQAEQWNEAHELIVENLAADAVINENLEYLKSLLTPLVPVECSSTITGWAHKGQLLWDYMLITSEIEVLLAAEIDRVNLGYKLELLQPQLSLLCSKINQFPCPTAKHRLCQAEIAKKTAHLARSLILLQSTANSSTAKILAHLVTQLPLPEDYAQQELRHIVNMCVSELNVR